MSNGECHAETAVSDSFCHTHTGGPAPTCPGSPWVSLEEPACPALFGFLQHSLAARTRMRPVSPRLATSVILAAPHPPGDPAGLGSPTHSRPVGLPRKKLGSPGAIPVAPVPRRGGRIPPPSLTPAVSTHRSLLCPARLRLGRAALAALAWPGGPARAPSAALPPSASPAGSPGPAPAGCPAPPPPSRSRCHGNSAAVACFGPAGRRGP